jgi:hypothetical protein
VSVTVADYDRAAAIALHTDTCAGNNDETDRDHRCSGYCGASALRLAIAQALAAERERTLASCYGRHHPIQLVVTRPGLVTCDGHTLQWRADPQGYAPPVETAKPDGGQPRRQIRVGETVDLAPHEMVDVVTRDGIPLLTIDGGPGGMTGVRFG